MNKYTKKRVALINKNQASNYYKLLKTIILSKGCSVEESSDLEKELFGVFYCADYLIEIKNLKSKYLMLIILAHEYGHFLSHIDFFKFYGKRAYNKDIKSFKFNRVDNIIGECNAWIIAEKELVQIDKNICLDYRFSLYRNSIIKSEIVDYCKKLMKKRRCNSAV